MLYLIPLCPLLGFCINGLMYLAQVHAAQDPHHVPSQRAGWIATASIFASFLVSLGVFISLVDQPSAAREMNQYLFSFIEIDTLKLGIGLRVDALSSLFTLVITGVGSLIHLYSIGYMSHDPAPGKFFAYLNLFCFAMLMLVLGSSLPLLFFGWEGVGLCSYLLIGFWYEDLAKARAGKKAFIVNRIGDCAFLIGMFLIFRSFHTLEFAKLRAAIHDAPITSELTTQLSAIALCLFVGCAGKSAQIPLYVWLPDAMAGPTPVSALIHAATMVTSGIYLVSRLNFLFALAPAVLQLMAWVGVLTALLAASVALKQRDIKKVLAYSTVSQLGYMFLACGVGAYTAGIFHVITHAFFKALLFLGAGSVIHGLDQEQDLGRMGGLRRQMPLTAAAFFVGWLAISGVPPLSGFFSKDEILWSAFSRQEGSPLLWVLGVLSALMTAFYMTRLVCLAFLGSPRVSSHSAHESPWTMTLPLGVLAILSATAGLLGLPHASWLEGWLEGVIPHHEAATHESGPYLEWILMGISTCAALGGIGAAWSRYRDVPVMESVEEETAHARGWERILLSKYYVDEAYAFLIVRPLQRLWKFLWMTVDAGLIDRGVMGLGVLCQRGGRQLKQFQTGSTQIYAIFMILGLIVVVRLVLQGGV